MNKSYLNQRIESKDGFTIIESIAALFILSILISISIPNFMKVIYKAKQSEASLSFSNFIKASKVFYSEFGILPRNARDLGNYIPIKACCVKCSPGQNNKSCNKNDAFSLRKSSAESWNTPSGNYSIKMISRNNELYFIAKPTINFKGYGVTACYNGLSGISQIIKSKDHNNLTIPNCKNEISKIDKFSNPQKGEKFILK